MLSLSPPLNSKLSIIFLSLVFLLSHGSLATAKPSWKNDESTEQPTKGSGKGGGKNKAQPTISDITITETPVSLSVNVGDTATFLVSAISSDGQDISYQWYFDGLEIMDANSDSYPIESASLDDQGEYSVSLSTADVTKTTQALLTVNVIAEPVVDIEISLQPVPQTVYVQDSLTLNVSATGSGSLNYQWRKNGIEIIGETQSYLNFSSINLNDGAQYDVIISNETGAHISNIATITVRPLATMSLSWEAPSTREDGSSLSAAEIDSYAIYLSYEGDSNEDVIMVSGALNNINLSEMFPGNYQFAIATTDISGNIGSRSETILVTIN